MQNRPEEDLKSEEEKRDTTIPIGNELPPGVRPLYLTPQGEAFCARVRALTNYLSTPTINNLSYAIVLAITTPALNHSAARWPLAVSMLTITSYRELVDTLRLFDSLNPALDTRTDIGIGALAGIIFPPAVYAFNFLNSAAYPTTLISATALTSPSLLHGLLRRYLLGARYDSASQTLIQDHRTTFADFRFDSSLNAILSLLPIATNLSHRSILIAPILLIYMTRHLTTFARVQHLLSVENTTIEDLTPFRNALRYAHTSSAVGGIIFGTVWGTLSTMPRHDSDDPWSSNLLATILLFALILIDFLLFFRFSRIAGLAYPMASRTALTVTEVAEDTPEEPTPTAVPPPNATTVLTQLSIESEDQPILEEQATFTTAIPHS